MKLYTSLEVIEDTSDLSIENSARYLYQGLYYTKLYSEYLEEKDYCVLTPNEHKKYFKEYVLAHSTPIKTVDTTYTDESKFMTIFGSKEKLLKDKPPSVFENLGSFDVNSDHVNIPDYFDGSIWVTTVVLLHKNNQRLMLSKDKNLLN